MISGGIETNYFAEIHLILETKFDDETDRCTPVN